MARNGKRNARCNTKKGTRKVNAIKGLILTVIIVIAVYGSAVIVGGWVGFAYVAYVNVTTVLIGKAQEK